MIKQLDTDYDIIIAGGGMIGTSLGLALAPLSLRIAIVEPVARSSADQPSFDDRSTALSRSSQRMFEAMGLWSEIVATATPIKTIHISDKGRFGFSHIEAEEQNVEALGYVVINRVLGEVLQRNLRIFPGIDVICPASVTGFSLSKRQAAVLIDKEGSEQELTCSLLVAADGANSGVRDMMGISATHIDYKQSAIIGNILTAKAHNNFAFERFTEDGPLAVLPLVDDRSAFVWINPTDKTDELLELLDKDFQLELQAAFGNRLGQFSKVGKRYAYPLSHTRTCGLTSRRGVVVGNAAHGLHPVAAQGFNLGLRDVAALCDCIAESRGLGEQDFVTNSMLEAYSSWRKEDQAKLVHFTHGIVKLFGDKRLSIRLLRDIGMIGFDLLPGVRKLFAKHTMGLAGRLPRLCRGVPLA